jgi:hypothetical protein
VAAGAGMPWVTLYGGLHPLRGTIGPHGKLLLMVGLLAVACAVFMHRRPRSAGRMLLPIALSVITFTFWLVFARLPSMMSSLRENPFIVAQPGQGPLVILVGGVLLLVGAAARVRGDAREVGRERHALCVRHAESPERQASIIAHTRRSNARFVARQVAFDVNRAAI